MQSQFQVSGLKRDFHPPPEVLMSCQSEGLMKSVAGEIFAEVGFSSSWCVGAVVIFSAVSTGVYV